MTSTWHPNTDFEILEAFLLNMTSSRDSHAWNYREIATLLTLSESLGKVSLVSYVGERPWWPIQSPNKEGGKRKANGYEEKEVRSILVILDLKDGRLQDSGKQEEGKTFHKLNFLWRNDDL